MVRSAKDAFYFPHDSNAKDDPKIVMLMEQLGLEGYGIFWVLIEVLRDQPEYRYPMALTSALARRFCTTKEKVEIVITGYSLFEVDGDNFFLSPSLCRRMLFIDDKRKKLAEAGRKGREKQLIGPPPGQAQATPGQEKKRKEKESKEKESKEGGVGEDDKKIFSKPSVADISAYCQERANKVDPDSFFNFYESKNWMVGKNKMANWKAAVHTWERKAGASQKKSCDLCRYWQEGNCRDRSEAQRKKCTAYQEAL